MSDPNEPGEPGDEIEGLFAVPLSPQQLKELTANPRLWVVLMRNRQGGRYLSLKPVEPGRTYHQSIMPGPKGAVDIRRLCEFGEQRLRQLWGDEPIPGSPSPD